MNCMSCNCGIILDESLACKYPEWKTIASSSSPKLVEGIPGVFGRAESKDGNSISTSDFSQLSVNESASMDGNIGHALLQQGNLNQILSDDSLLPIDHPLCSECALSLDKSMQRQLAEMQHECHDYQLLLAKLQSTTKQNTDSGINVSTLRRKLTEIQSEEKALKMQLVQLELEEREIDDKMAHENKSLTKYEIEEERLWRVNRDQLRKLMELEEEERSVDNQLQYVNEQLTKLTKTNIFNMAFHIWPSGRFGTINGLRLGRLPDDKVEWPEINAAWGQVALLMQSLCAKLELTLQDYEIVPLGAFSYMKSSPNGGKDLPLYHTGTLMADTKFDAAMSAFLHCVKQLQDVMKAEGNVLLPYEIRTGEGGRLCICGDKGKELSMRLQLMRPQMGSHLGCFQGYCPFFITPIL